MLFLAWGGGGCTKILLSKVRHVGLARKSVFLEDRRCRCKALAFQEMLPYIVMRFVGSHDTELALPELPALSATKCGPSKK